MEKKLPLDFKRKINYINNMKIIGYFTVSILTIIYSTILNGWTFAKLWSWFIVSTFHLPTLSIAAAIGISIVVTYLTHQTDLNKEKSEKSFGEQLFTGFLFSTFKSLFALSFGFIIKLWM